MGLAASETEAQLRLQNNLDSNTVGLSVERSSRRFSLLFLKREQVRPGYLRQVPGDEEGGTVSRGGADLCLGSSQDWPGRLCWSSLPELGGSCCLESRGPVGGLG